MTDIAQVLREARRRLIETLALEASVASLEARVLLGEILQQPRVFLLANPDYGLSPTENADFDRLLARRLSGEPLAYILGRREFYGLEFEVTPDVLIPRSDTELLVDTALSAIPEDQAPRILDLGTGSGAIALTLAKLRPRARILAVDISAPALEIARRNAKRLDVGTVDFLQSDWFAAIAPDQRFELIVANPPYIAEGDPHLTLGDLRFEPATGLRADQNGLGDLQRIAGQAREFLVPDGQLMLEHGFDQETACADILASCDYGSIRCYRDLAGQARVTIGKHP